MPSKREQLRARRRAEKTRTITLAVVIGAVLVAAAAYFVWNGVKASPTNPTSTLTASDLGRAVPLLTDTSHVEEGTDPGPYNSDPPTSGRHYANPAQGGFYNNDPFPSHPEGYLVHSLEHGYIIFWYNCDLLNESACADLKSQIRDVMNQENNLKVIAFPWPSLDVPLVVTSWGQIMEMETFDPQKAAAFVETFRNHAPEPDAP
jgi:uncharacterized protein DUF3105